MSEQTVKIVNSRGQYFGVTEYDYEIDKGTNELVEIRISTPLNHSGSIGRTETMRIPKESMQKIAEVYSKSQWISVEERLPDVDIDEDHDEGVGRFLTVNHYGTVLVKEFVLNKNGKWFWCTIGDRRFRTPATHWQPLPLPPKNKQQ